MIQQPIPSDYDVIECEEPQHRQMRAADARAAHLEAVLRKIDERAPEPGFRLETIAAELGVSSRYLRRLLQATGKTFSAYRTERRLDRAFALLTDPASNRLSVTEIALQSGFGDISHFNHCFRHRFGDTPTAVRANMRTDGLAAEPPIAAEA